jgi:hypothetical protein
VSAGQALERFPEPPARKELEVRDRLLRVEAHEIEIAPEPPVLEPVVEDEGVGAEFLEEPPADFRAVWSHGNRETGEGAGELHGLVSGLLGRSENATPVRDENEVGLRPSAVTTREDGDLLASREEIPRESGDDGGLPAPPDGEVSDAHHLRGKLH